MDRFIENPRAITYLVGPNKAAITKFARKHKLQNWAPVTEASMFPASQGSTVILLKGYNEMPDYELLFGGEAMFCLCHTKIFYWHEVN